MARPSRKFLNKKRILDSALSLIAKNGFHGAPMSQLAKAAFVSVGTIYLYFHNKEDVIKELFKEVQNKMEAEILSGFSNKKSFEKNFVSLFNNTVKFYKQNPEEFSFMEQYGISPYVKGFEQFSFNVRKAMEFVIQQGYEESRIEPMSVEVLTSLIYGPILQHMKQYHFGLAKLGPVHIKALRQGCLSSVSKGVLI